MYPLNFFRGEKNVLNFDLDGGTSDVYVLIIDEGSLFDVRSTAGDTHQGEDVDIKMNSSEMDNQTQISKDLRSNPRVLRRLRTPCQRAHAHPPGIQRLALKFMLCSRTWT
ncbi:heat shock protein 70 [Nephila pilipes]|uniref:Heat shock protein 70 n=1 Tax=Nephila pilipes TaxID=299642 RepID=A0A8X6KFT4_NEPPI|nr:heat shock protein 70 [Nephila pilipes]